MTEGGERSDGGLTVSTAVGPTVVQRWRAVKWVVLGVIVIAAASVLTTFLTSPRPGGRMDPGSTSADGAHALLSLLRDQGIDVVEAGSIADVERAARPDTLLVLAETQYLSDDEGLQRLAAVPGDRLLVEPVARTRKVLAPGIRVALSSTLGGNPDCDMPEANRAGEVQFGPTTTYEAEGDTTLTRCYEGAVVRYSEGGHTVTVVGSADFMTNAGPAQGGQRRARHEPGRHPAPAHLVRASAVRDRTPMAVRRLTDLIPDRVGWIVYQLCLAAILVALWRGRRVGPLVAEDLPVVVRASETVEGRGRLYRSRRARDRAAEALRTAALHRMLPRLGLGPNAEPTAVAQAVAQRIGARPERAGALTVRSAARQRRGPGQPCQPTGRHRKAGRTVVNPNPPADSTADEDAARNALHALRNEIGKAVVGQDAVVSGLVIALLCRGHVLLEGVPGVAKTLLVRTLSAALQLEFKRVQFTPDLMPGDVTGSLVYDARTAEFEFRSGPVFTNLLLADEINRTPPKTQAALLEAMEERQVSVDGEPRPLPDPFIVAATQNPIEYEGTYQLPEAQLDRFLLKLNVPLPPRDQEMAILSRHAHGFDPRDLSAVRPVAGPAELAAGRAGVARVLVADEVLGYIVDVVGATRQSPSLQLGVSPRGSTALLATARSWAWLSGRNYVTPDDVKAMARPTLRHRIALRPEAELEGATPDGVLDGILASVPVPR